MALLDLSAYLPGAGTRRPRPQWRRPAPTAVAPPAPPVDAQAQPAPRKRRPPASMARRVLAALHEDVWQTCRRVSDRSGVPFMQTANRLLRLERRGHVERITAAACGHTEAAPGDRANWLWRRLPEAQRQNPRIAPDSWLWRKMTGRAGPKPTGSAAAGLGGEASVQESSPREVGA